MSVDKVNLLHVKSDLAKVDQAKDNDQVTDSCDLANLFVHISDVEGPHVPRRGDKVMYKLCPIPPKFDKVQAVQVEIVEMTGEKHSRWENPETREELEEEEEVWKDQEHPSVMDV